MYTADTEQNLLSEGGEGGQEEETSYVPVSQPHWKNERNTF